MASIKTIRNEIISCYDNPLNPADWVCTKPCVPTGVPGNFHPEKCQVLFVGFCATKEEAAAKSPKKAAFSSPSAKVFIEYLVKAGITESRMGFTNLIKCNVKNRATRKKVAANCSQYFKREIDAINPKLIVLMGSDVKGILLPELTPTKKLDDLSTVAEGDLYITPTRNYMVINELKDYVKKDKIVDGAMGINLKIIVEYIVNNLDDHGTWFEQKSRKAGK